MKKLILPILFFALITQHIAVYAQSPTASPSAQFKFDDLLKQEKIKELRNRIASRVAELRQKTDTQKALLGDIKNIQKDSITVATAQGDSIIAVDSETNYFRFTSGAKKIIKLADLSVGDKIAAWGIGEKENVMTGGVIVTNKIPTVLHGTVVKMDKKNFTITVQAARDGEHSIDVETTTKISRTDKSNTITKIGFSTIIPGDYIFVSGVNDLNDQPKLSADKILILPYAIFKFQTTASSSAATTTNQITPTKAILKKPTP